MNFIGNLLLLIFGGFLSAPGYFFGGLVLCITITGITFGFQCFKIAGLVYGRREKAGVKKHE